MKNALLVSSKRFRCLALLQLTLGAKAPVLIVVFLHLTIFCVLWHRSDRWSEPVSQRDVFAAEDLCTKVQQTVTCLECNRAMRYSYIPTCNVSTTSLGFGQRHTHAFYYCLHYSSRVARIDSTLKLVTFLLRFRPYYSHCHFRSNALRGMVHDVLDICLRLHFTPDYLDSTRAVVLQGSRGGSPLSEPFARLRGTVICSCYTCMIMT